MLCEGITPTEATFNRLIKEDAAAITAAMESAARVGGATYYVIYMREALDVAQRIVLLFANHWTYDADVSGVVCPCREIPDRE